MSDEALIRRERLKSLKLSPTELAERMPVPEDGKPRRPSYFSDLMNKPAKSFGEKAARSIEQALGLPPFWLDGREADQDSPRAAPKAAPKGAQTEGAGEQVLAALNLIRSRLVNASEETGERAGEALKRLAINPDSERAFGSAADILIVSGGSAVQLLEVKDGPAAQVSAAEWRKQAMRLAEAHSDPKSRALLVDFLGKLDSLMRAIEPTTEKPTETRQGKSSPTNAGS